MSNLIKVPYKDINMKKAEICASVKVIYLFAILDTDETNQLIDEYFVTTKINSWKAIGLIKHIVTQVSIVDMDKFKSGFVVDFERYCSQYSPRNNASSKKMEKLKSRFSNIVKSDAATLVIMESTNRNKKVVYSSVLANKVLNDQTNYILESTGTGKSSSSSNAAHIDETRLIKKKLANPQEKDLNCDPGWEEKERLPRLAEITNEAKKMNFDEDVLAVDD